MSKHLPQGLVTRRVQRARAMHGAVDVSSALGEPGGPEVLSCLLCCITGPSSSSELLGPSRPSQWLTPLLLVVLLLAPRENRSAQCRAVDWSSPQMTSEGIRQFPLHIHPPGEWGTPQPTFHHPRALWLELPLSLYPPTGSSSGGITPWAVSFSVPWTHRTGSKNFLFLSPKSMLSSFNFKTLTWILFLFNSKVDQRWPVL